MVKCKSQVDQYPMLLSGPPPRRVGPDDGAERNRTSDESEGPNSKSSPTTQGMENNSKI